MTGAEAYIFVWLQLGKASFRIDRIEVEPKSCIEQANAISALGIPAVCGRKYEIIGYHNWIAEHGDPASKGEE